MFPFNYNDPYDETPALKLVKEGDYFRRGLGQYEKALACYQKALKLDPNCFPALFNCGIVYKETNRLSEAISVYERALEIKPKDFSSNYMLGACYLMNYQYSKAIEILTIATKLKSRDQVVWMSLGIAYDCIFEHVSALEAFQKAIDINPNNKLVLLNKAITLKKQGKLSEAEIILEKLIQKPPIDPTFFSLLGVVKYLQRQFLDAKLRFENVLQAIPNMTICIINHAMTLSSLGFSDSAIVNLKKAVKYKGAEHLYWLYLSKLYLEKKNLSNAIDYAKKAYESQKNFHLTIANYSYILNEIGKEKKAKSILSKLHKIPLITQAYQDLLGSDYLWEFMGDYFKDKNEYEKALTCYNKAITINPTNESLIVKLSSTTNVV